MAYEHKIDSGSIFRNDDRATETQPHYKGSAKLSSPKGEIFDIWVSGWINETSTGTKFMSLKFNPKEKREPASTPSMDFDEDMPF